MREIAEKSVGWLVIGGIILAILVAKKRAEGKFAAAVAAARAEGHAAALAGASAQSNVNVAVDASNGRAGGHQCDDLFTCAICAPIALRVLVAADRGGLGVGGPGTRLPARLDYHDYDDDHAADYSAVVRTAGAGVRNDGGSGARGRGPGGDAWDSRGVEVVPCESLNESSKLSDLLARPWAYDEADPRCEVKRA